MAGLRVRVRGEGLSGRVILIPPTRANPQRHPRGSSEAFNMEFGVMFSEKSMPSLLHQLRLLLQGRIEVATKKHIFP